MLKEGNKRSTDLTIRMRLIPKNDVHVSTVHKWGFGEEWIGELTDSKSRRPGVR
jgi:hypothetical protein